METKKIYFKSDFTVILASEAQWGGCPFRLSFYTASPSRPFVACFDGENYHNCRLLPDGRLEIGINQKDGNVQTLMGIGKLMLAPEFYLDNDAFRDHVCNEFIKPFAPVFVDTDGTEYQVTLDMQGSSTLTTIGTLPAFYQKGLTQEEHDALIAATQDALRAAEEAGNVSRQVTALIWQVTAYFELIQRRFDESQTERTNTFNASERARTATFNEKEAQRDAAVAEAVRKANEACETLTNTFNTITSSLSADYASTKSQLAQDYAQTVASFNQRMTAIEQQFAGDREAWAKNVSDFIAACQATFDAKIAQWQTLIQEAANNANEKATEAANVNAVLNGDNLTVTDRQGNSVTRNVRGPKGDSITMFPNVTIFGQPTIQESQISNFSADNYLQFPFVVDFAGRPWQIDCAITTGSNVSQQHNVLDSAFGLAFAFSGGKFVLALSSDGTSWNLGATSGTHTILANTTYYIRISWNGSVYKLAYSTDKETWVDDITVTSSASLASKQIIIGKSLDNRYIFNGSINMAEAHLTISGKIVWEGMDDAGLATRMAIDMSNIDDEGKQRLLNIVNESTIGQQVQKNTKSIDNINNTLKDVFVYGVLIDEHLASPDLQRVGDMDLHKTLPIQSMMRRCLLLDDGTVNYYLDENNSLLKEDGTAANLDGTDGQVMVEIPHHYRRLTFLDTYADGLSRYKVEISLFPINGAVEVPKMYVSAWEATVDRSNGNMLSSVVNTDARYRGGNNQSAWDGTYRSVLGMPATSISLTNYRAYARKRGEGWNCYEYRAHLALFWLYTIEYATLHSQKAYNAELDEDGYRQGGMGDGVSNINSTKWNNYNSYYPVIPCGYTASLGNKTGIVPFSFDEEQQAAYDGTWTTNVPSYRGVENPFGHIFKWTDGVMFEITADADGGTSKACKAVDTADYGTTAKYVPFADIPRASGYMKHTNITGSADIILRATGAASTTYFCDYFLTLLPASGTSWCGLLVGGYAYSGSAAGLACVFAYNAATYTIAYYGSRLCFCGVSEL